LDERKDSTQEGGSEVSTVVPTERGVAINEPMWDDPDFKGGSARWRSPMTGRGTPTGCSSATETFFARPGGAHEENPFLEDPASRRRG
jgi:hypothetical protein